MFFLLGSMIDMERCVTVLGEPAKATFVYNAHHKSGTTNLPEGVVHIFRESKPSHDTPQTGSYAAAVAETTRSVDSRGISQTIVESDDLTLAVLAVPSWMTPSDFLTFVSPAADGIAHLRMIRFAFVRCCRACRFLICIWDRDSAPNRSIVVMKFREMSHAAEFIEEYNGKQFNSLEVCTACQAWRYSLSCCRNEHSAGNVPCRSCALSCRGSR